MYRPIPWLIPPLLGLGAYLLAGAGAPWSSTDQAAPSARTETKLPRVHGIKDLSAELQRLEEEWQRQETAKDQHARENTDPFSKPDGAALRARLMELMEQAKSLGEDSDREAREAIGEKITQALRDLARSEGGDALAWVEEHLSDGRLIFMDSWAEVDPEGALQAVIASKRKPPCTYETLSQLLQSRAKDSPSSLREACDRVPWELFCHTDAHMDPFEESTGMALPEGADPGPWLKSGAAEAMAKQGVTITNLFSLWARHDPEQALARLEDWPGEGDSRKYRLNHILFAGSHDEEIRQNIERAMDALPAENRERLVKEVSNSPQRAEMVALYPRLEDPEPAPARDEEAE